MERGRLCVEGGIFVHCFLFCDFVACCDGGGKVCVFVVGGHGTLSMNRDSGEEASRGLIQG